MAIPPHETFLHIPELLLSCLEELELPTAISPGRATFSTTQPGSLKVQPVKLDLSYG